MKKWFLIGLLIGCIIAMMSSCKIQSIACDHVIMIPVTTQTDSAQFYTVSVPFCDSVHIIRKKSLKKMP